MARTPSDLRAAVRDPAFTPAVTDVPALVALLADEDEVTALERVLARQAPAAAAAAATLLATAQAPRRARLVHLLGRLAADVPSVTPRLIELTCDPDPKASRLALVALGKLPGPDGEAALLRAAGAPRSPAHLRAAVEALGKIGGRDAAAALAAIARPTGSLDPALSRVAARARLRVARTASRDLPSEIAADVAPAAPLPVLLRCRPGLERLLADELGPGFHAAGPGRAAGELKGPMGELYRARTFLDFGFPRPLTSLSPVAIASAIYGARDVLGRFTRGAIRYRLAFASGGHRRALVQDIAAAVADRTADLQNDPTASTWEIEIADRQIILVPRRIDDPRFAYRLGDLPAASHPTLAAALARVAGVRDGDIVWDPFVGSASELIERARLGRFRALHGTDRDPAALEAARKNLAAAGVTAKLELGNAFGPPPAGVTLILTNPPMGRRVARPDLARFVEHAAAALAPGGRFVWISPLAEETETRARSSGLHATYTQTVEMGGFSAEIQAFEKATSRPVLPSRRVVPPSTSTSRRSRA